ncbi:MAG: ABC transporter ATP-binding protein [Dehalococcoidia bacterium]
MLSARGLTKRYGSVTALQEVSFELGDGRVLALVGPNGAGKTTLIKCLIGLVKFEGGAEIQGVDVARKGRQARALVGYLPQNPAFHADMTVAETALFYADLKGLPAARARAVVESAGLSEHAQKRTGALSGGMRQRLALAMALLAEPPVLIFDEPVAGLDIGARLELRRLVLEQRAKGISVLLSTHWLEDVPYIADDVLVLDHLGRPVTPGPATRLNGATLGASRLYLRVNGRTPDAIHLINGMLPDGAVDRSGDWLVVACQGSEKARVVENLVVSGIKVLDFRVEETPVDTALIERLTTGGEL